MPLALILLWSYASRAMANVKIKLPQKQCIYCGVGNYREVDIEDPPAVTVLPSIGDDGPFSLEAVRGPVLELPGGCDFVDAILQEIR